MQNQWRWWAAVIFTGLLPALAAAQPAPLPPRVFSHPDRLRYDSQCFTIEGKDTFIYSGAFHYFRCPKALWNDRFDKIKAAGFNAVETYVAWNMQEPDMPASVDDYSKADLKDLDDWLTMAEQHGLYVILRPGPYICAEWDCGGFPQWLLPKRPAGYKGKWLRSDEPAFVAWSKHWFHAVDQVAVKHQLTHHKPGEFGIILYQLENEYGGNQHDDVEVRYLHALGQQAWDDGIDVPLFTCWTAVVRGSSDPVLRQTYDSCNFYPRYAVDSIGPRIDQLRREQPDAPLQTTELQGGWFSNVGGASTLSHSWTEVIQSMSPAQIQNLTLYAIEKGDRITNYYMLFGGTNFSDYAPVGITTSYDYSAPIREIGCVGEKYQRVAEIGAMLKEHGERLARATPLGLMTTTDQKDVTVTGLGAADGSVYLFVRTNQHTEPRKGHFTAARNGITSKPTAGEWAGDYDLEPFGSKILYVPAGKTVSSAEWLPKSLPEIKRPTQGLPGPISLAEAVTQVDPGPVKWEPLKDGQTLEQMGIDDRRFVFYRATIDGGEATTPPPPLQLGITGPARDGLLAVINGDCEPGIVHPGGQKPVSFRPGPNKLEMIYENVGQPNGGADMEKMAGITRIGKLVSDGQIRGWKMSKITPKGNRLRPEQLKEIGRDFDDSPWTEVKTRTADDATQLEEGEWAVFRTTVECSADRIKAGNLNLQLSRMDDQGWVFINGKQVVHGTEWSEEYTFPAAGLVAGKNSVAVVIQNSDGRGGLGAVSLLDSPAQETGYPVEFGAESTGHAGQWWKSDLDVTSWKPAGGDGNAAHLNWYRWGFELPAPVKGVWVPWVARLNLRGNGFLYLNDHPIGRYWNAGPQHDFFLPECWLNFGPGQKNVLTACLRSVDGKSVGITAAEVVPVTEGAEFRR